MLWTVSGACQLILQIHFFPVPSSGLDHVSWPPLHWGVATCWILDHQEWVCPSGPRPEIVGVSPPMPLPLLRGMMESWGGGAWVPSWWQRAAIQLETRKKNCVWAAMYFVSVIKLSLLSNFMGSSIDMDKQTEEFSGGWCGKEQGERKRVKMGCLGLVFLKRNRDPKMESLVLSSTSVNGDWIPIQVQSLPGMWPFTSQSGIFWPQMR